MLSITEKHIKSIAREIVSLSKKEHPLKHTSVLETLSKSLGYRSYSGLSAALKNDKLCKPTNNKHPATSTPSEPYSFGEIVNPDFLESLNFIQQGKNAIVTGEAGSGKTTYVKNILKNAKMKGISALYLSAHDLYDVISSMKSEKEYLELTEEFFKYKLLIVDDFGIYPTLDEKDVECLSFIRPRMRESSTVIVSQSPVYKWDIYAGSFLGEDSTLVDYIKGSYKVRLERNSKERIEV